MTMIIPVCSLMEQEKQRVEKYHWKSNVSLYLYYPDAF